VVLVVIQCKVFGYNRVWLLLTNMVLNQLVRPQQLWVLLKLVHL